MPNFVSNYVADESGAVTVDFVVITAGIAFLTLLTVVGIREQAVETTDTTAQVLLDYDMDVPGILD